MNHRNHHLKSAVCALAAGALVPLFGWCYARAEHLPWWHGAYCALGAAVTTGGDCVNRGGAGYAIAALEFAILVPLSTAAVSFGISHLTTRNVHAAVSGRPESVPAKRGEGT